MKKILFLFSAVLITTLMHSQTAEAFRRFRGNQLINADGTPFLIDHDLKLDSSHRILVSPVKEGAAVQQRLLFFPNPASDRVSVISPLASVILISDLRGTIVLRREIMAGENTLDISAIKDGDYLVRSFPSGEFQFRLSVSR